MDATKTKPFNIDKKLVYDAYKAVKINAGAAGVDGQSLEMFDKDLMKNLYKIWNRMSSGSYFPPPVRAVPIPKKTGGQRILGVPPVADRVAQMVVKKIVEREVEPIFLPDSYGYRPNKSAIDAIGVTRKRCWQYDYVLEFDIRGLFDNIDHTLLLRAVRKHVKCKWSLLVTAQVSQAGFNPAEAWRSGAGGLWSTLREGPNLASWLWRGASGSLRNRRRLARSGSHQRSSAAASSCARRVRPGCW